MAMKIKTATLALIVPFFAAASVSVDALGERPSVALDSGLATAKIELDGAKVVSLKVGGEEVLWMSQVPGVPGIQWSHGGIPVCWPWFGRSGAPQPGFIHGFARNFRFEVVDTSSCRGRSQAMLRLKSSDATRRIWPHDFELTFEATLTDTLRLSLRTVNTGSDTFSMTAGFHPYFRLGDLTKTKVTGADGLLYCDSRKTQELGGPWRGDIVLGEPLDHVFAERGATAAHSIIDPVLGRRIYSTSSGVTRLVVWTACADDSVGDGPGQLSAGDWRHLACVEPALLWDQVITLDPGCRHQFGMEISITPTAAR